MHVIDAVTLRETRSITVGRSPSGMIVSPDNTRLYVANRESDTISVVDLASFDVIAAIAVGKAPFGLTYDAAGAGDGRPRLLVANVQSGDVSVVDPVASKELRQLKVRDFPYVVAVTRDGARILVTNQHDDSVSIFDGKSYEPLALLRTADYPEGLMIAPDQAHALVVCWMDDVLESIDLRNLSIDRKLPVGAGPRGFGQFLAP